MVFEVVGDCSFGTECWRNVANEDSSVPPTDIFNGDRRIDFSRRKPSRVVLGFSTLILVLQNPPQLVLPDSEGTFADPEECCEPSEGDDPDAGDVNSESVAYQKKSTPRDFPVRK